MVNWTLLQLLPGSGWKAQSSPGKAEPAGISLERLELGWQGLVEDSLQSSPLPLLPLPLTWDENHILHAPMLLCLPGPCAHWPQPPCPPTKSLAFIWQMIFLGCFKLAFPLPFYNILTVRLLKCFLSQIFFFPSCPSLVSDFWLKCRQLLHWYFSSFW